KNAKVLRKAGARWTPLPGSLAGEATFSLVLPVKGKPVLLVETEKGAKFVDLTGKDAGLSFQTELDGERIEITGASVDASGQTLASGFVHEPEKKESGSGLGLVPNAAGGFDGGIAVIERWPAGAKTPIVERMTDAKLAAVDEGSGAGVFSAGEKT